MKKLILLSSLVVMLSITAYGQDYRTGIGIRGGLSNGLTFKHFITTETALEALVTTRWNGFLVTGLYERHASAFGITGFYWYYGFGAHMGSWNHHYKSNKEDNYSVIGIDGIIGMEYNITEIPFNISIDYKPGLNLLGKPLGMSDEVAISIRYVFGYR
jgi:hypothetical protein